MKHKNLIDLSAYFAAMQQQNAPAVPVKRRQSRIFGILNGILEAAATTVMALCVCACTLLFFTML